MNIKEPLKRRKPRKEKSLDAFAKWFGARLRDALGSTPQTEIATLMTQDGLKTLPGSISHYMQGRRYPDPPIFKALVKALGVSADWALGLTEQRLPVADLEEMLAQAKGESRINRLMKQLPPTKQQQVVEYTEFLIDQQRKDDGSGHNLTQRQRDQLRAARVLDSVDKEFGSDVRVQLEKIIRAKGNDLTSGNF